MKRAENLTNNIKPDKPKLLPPNYNKFIALFFQKFLYNNIDSQIYNKYSDYQIGFRIEALILDSPYTKFNEFMDDNLTRLVPSIPKFLISPIYHYFKTWLSFKMKIDLS